MSHKKPVAVLCVFLIVFSLLPKSVAAQARSTSTGAAVDVSQANQISDEVAYRLLFRAIGSRRESSELLKLAAEALLSACDFDTSEAEAILAIASEFSERVAGLERKAASETNDRSPMLTERDRVVTDLVKSLTARLGPSLETKLRTYLAEHVKPNVKIIPVREMADADDPYCGDGNCDGNEDYTWCDDCHPPGPSCGELGGDECSQSGSCPEGYDSLGGTYDCNPCCKSEPPPPPRPSCGAMGGDYCSQDGSCPDGYDSLGQSNDCDPCCKSQPPPPPTPSCDAMGGDYCSQSGSCPEGYDSLGQSNDCNPCCKSQPPPDDCGNGNCDAGEDVSTCPRDCANVYVYSDESYDGNTLYVYNSAETDYPGGDARVELEVTVTDDSDGSVDAAGTAAGYPAASLTLTPTYPPPEPTELEPASQSTLQSTEATGTSVVSILGVVVLATSFWRSLRSWWSKVKLGTSSLCFYFPPNGDQIFYCLYYRYEYCPVYCADKFHFAKEVKDYLIPVCDPTPLKCKTYWSKKGSVVTCAKEFPGLGGICYHQPVRYCSQSPK